MRIPKKFTETLESTTNNVAFVRILSMQEKKRTDEFCGRDEDIWQYYINNAALARILSYARRLREEDTNHALIKGHRVTVSRKSTKGYN